MKFENEEKAKQNKILREKNNRIVLENEKFREEIEKLSKFMHIAEDRSEMVRSVNPCGESDQLVVDLNLTKNGLAKRSKKREAKLRVKNQKLEIF